MILVCVLIGILFYVSLETINYFRLNYYRINLVTGPIQLVAEMAAKQPPDYQAHWVEDVGRTLDSHMKLVDGSQLKLSDSDLKRLQQNKPVLRMLDDLNRKGEAIIRVPDKQEHFIVARGQYLTEQQARGMAELLAQYLTSEPVPQWNSILARLNHQFGFAIQRIPPFQVKLDDEKKHRLFNDEQAVASFSGNRGGNTQITAYKLLTETGEVLKLGPQELFNWYPFELMVVLVVIALALVGERRLQQ